MLALILLACSNTHDFNALAPGAVLLGLAGITFHLSQFHMSNLFPRSRGFISSLLVAGFTGCGAVFYFLDLIFIAAGSTRSACRPHRQYLHSSAMSARWGLAFPGPLWLPAAPGQSACTVANVCNHHGPHLPP